MALVEMSQQSIHNYVIECRCSISAFLYCLRSMDVGSLEQDIRPTVRVARGDGGHCGRQFETTQRDAGTGEVKLNLWNSAYVLQGGPLRNR